MTREEHIENLKAIASDMPSDKCSDWIESLMAGVKALEQEPCNDCISRQATIDAVNGWETVPVKVLKMMPSVTPVEKVGYWIEQPNGFECSECHIIRAKGTTGKYNYCPCGAKMGGEQDAVSV